MTKNPIADWYPDPQNPMQERYWEGSRWGEQTRPAAPSTSTIRAHHQAVSDSKKTTAGILAIVLGGLGVHKFYLGYTGAGVLQIVITLVTCGFGSVLALAEGVIYLTKSDEEFVATYQRNRKPWF